MKPRVILYGATGHTGRFIAKEMARRRWRPILAGRDMSTVAPIAERHGAEARKADVGSPTEIDALLSGADAIINAAGPFGDTAPQLIGAALREGIPYFDVTAEPFVATEIFETFGEPARVAGAIVAPAFGFFGALGDLLVTAAMGDWDTVDSIELAFALDRWRPTNGTRLAGRRRAGRRLVLADGRLQVHEATEAQPKGKWSFAPPFGEQPMIGEFSTVDVVTISQHVEVKSMATWINEAPIADLISADPSGPQATDESGRSAQQFAVDVIVRRGSDVRRATASGRDIYAVTAPIVCEAVERVLHTSPKSTGVLSAGQMFEARDFIAALSPDPLSIEFE